MHNRQWSRKTRCQTRNVGQTERVELFSQRSNLLLLTTVSRLPSSPKHLYHVCPVDVLEQLVREATIEAGKPKTPRKSWCDGRSFASTPFRRMGESRPSFPRWRFTLVAVAGDLLHLWSSDYER